MGDFCLTNAKQDIESAKRAARTYIMAGTWDPTEDNTAAYKGTLFLRVGALGGEQYIKKDDGCSTKWERASAAALPTTLLYVDSNRVDAYTEDGTSAKPYKTIQAALNSFGDAANLADVLSPQTLLIAPGNYDEDILIPKGRIVSLLGLGTWTLGDGAAGGFDSTVARSVTFQPDANLFGAVNVRPGLTIGTLGFSEASSTFIATSHCVHISGDIVIADAGGITHTLNLHGVKVWGAMLKPVNVALTNIQMYRCYVKGLVNMPAGQTIFSVIESCEFDQLITITEFSRMSFCEIDGGMTVTAIGNTIPPSGMFACDFHGNFTGPAGSAKMDGSTNYFFKANAAVLAGGATKVILDDSAP